MALFYEFADGCRIGWQRLNLFDGISEQRSLGERFEIGYYRESGKHKSEKHTRV